MPTVAPQGSAGNVGIVTYWNDIVIDKAADQSSTTTAFANIVDFTNIELPQGVHMFEIRAIVAAPTAGDFTIRLATTGSLGEQRWGKQTTEIKESVLTAQQDFDFTSGTSALLILQGIVEFTDAAGGTITAQFAQLVATGITTVQEGSTFAFRQTG